MAWFKTGGGGGDYALKHYTTNITFNDNSTYHSIANGRFVSCTFTRSNVSTAPVLQFFLKDSQGNYNPISLNQQTVTGNNSIGTSETGELTKGNIYVKKSSGSTFTTTSMDVRYL